MRLLLAFVMLLTVNSWSQTHYYVDKVIGLDTNNGSLATPWKTIQKAATSATANSIVHIKAGTYYENVTVNTNGTSNGPIVFTNFNGPVILDGTGTSGTVMLSITNRSNITFENITIQNLVKAYAKGINLNSASGTCNNITFRNITVKNISWTSNLAQIPQEADNAWAMYVRGQSGGITNLTIENCNVHDNVIGYSEAVTVGGNVNGFLIKGCTVYDNTNIGIHVSGAINGTGPRNGVIKNNTCYGNVSPIAISAGIYIDGPSLITVEKNRCYQNPIGIEVGCENDGAVQYVDVKNNLLYFNAYSGLQVGGYTTSTTGQVLYSTFRNNTLYKNNSYLSGSAEITISKASHCVFEENIIYGNSQGILLSMANIQPQTDNLLNYNCWFTDAGNIDELTFYCGLATYESFSEYRNATGQDANSLFANPGFTNPLLPQPLLTLLPDSICINTGNPVLTIAGDETDFDGNPRIVNNVIDMGAREFGVQLSLDESDAGVFSLTPNPFGDQTTITVRNPVQNGSLALFDLSGRKVRQISQLFGNQIVIAREDLAAGCYLFQLADEGRIVASGKLLAK